MDAITLVFFIAGLALLIVGAELLVRGSSRLAAAIGLSPLVIGLTVAAYGTSTPELAVTVQAALLGQADIALGNVVGSNIFNILFILGLCAVVVPMAVSQQLVRLDVPIMMGASLLLSLLALDGKISRPEGALLFAGIVVYTAFAIRQSRRESEQIREEYAREFGEAKLTRTNGRRIILQIGLILAGLACLVLGSRWLAHGAVAIARNFGLSELIVGLTIVAAGTSLPEVATSIVASVRGERDIAVGNIVGSNIYNILAAVGLAGILAPDGIRVPPAALRFDIPVMIAVALACLPIFFTGNTIARWEGALFFGYYVAYTLYLILGATQHDALPAYSAIMLLFVLPLTAVTLLIVTVRALRARRHGTSS